MLRVCLSCCLMLIAGCADRSSPTVRTEMKATNATAENRQQDQQTEEPLDRKIVYEVRLELEVRDFSVTENSLPRLVEEHGGYLSETAIDRNSGKYLSGC